MRQIGTAKQKNGIIITGWIYPQGQVHSDAMFLAPSMKPITCGISSDPEVLFCIRLHLCRGLRGISRSFAMANCIFLHAAFASSGIVPVQLPTLSTLLHICDPE